MHILLPSARGVRHRRPPSLLVEERRTGKHQLRLFQPKMFGCCAPAAAGRRRFALVDSRSGGTHGSGTETRAALEFQFVEGGNLYKKLFRRRILHERQCDSLVAAERHVSGPLFLSSTPVFLGFRPIRRHR